MASTYTPLGVELQATGENAGTWRTTTNTNLSNYFLNSMYQNKDPDYGIGFLKMNKVLEEQGWKQLLKRLGSIK